MTDIAGRVAVITGGASGIGRGIAEVLLEDGATVVIADNQREILRETAAELGVHAVHTDVSDAASVQALADEVVTRYGSVGIAVNNAGIGVLGRVDELALADWTRMIDVNLWGVIHGVRSFLPLLKANPDGGHLVNTGSMASFRSDLGLAGYAVSKYGVCALTETLALELADEGSAVHVTLLAPGTVRTGFGRGPQDASSGHGAGVDAAEPTDGIAAGMRAIDPIDAARVVVRAIRDNDLYAPTHTEWWPVVESRFSAIGTAFGRYAVEEDV